MKIIILGAGQVGMTLAENLVSEDNDITLIDNNAQRLEYLQNKHDLLVIEGSASSPHTLREAGAADADLIVAVTDSDEVNMVASQIAYTLFNTPTKIARIRSQEYIQEKDRLFNNNMIPIDYIISPENLVTEEITRLIEYPGALQVAYFANRQIALVTLKAYYGGPLVGYPISHLKEHLPYTGARIVSILRNNKAIHPQGSTIIEAGDEVTFVCATLHIRAIMSEIQRLEKPYKRIMLIGGGNIGKGVAQQLQDKCSVKLIERNPERAKQLAENLPNTLIFHGDISDQNLLFEEHIDKIDLFLALTSDDEANIMAAQLAKRLGAKNAMVLIQRIAYLNLIHGSQIDIAISPQQSSISALLAHVRRGDIPNVTTLRYGQAEAMEMVIHGDATSSNVVGRKIHEIKLPSSVMIGAILRGALVIIAEQDEIIEAGDHVILYIGDKRDISEVEKLFEPSALFI